MDIGGRPDWYDDALCKHVENALALYFPTNTNPNTASIAKKICEDCPVKQRCFDYSIELSRHVDVHGVWGGMSMRDRKNYMREHNIPSRTATYNVEVFD